MTQTLVAGTQRTGILSAQFDDFERAGIVADELQQQGFASDDIEQFQLNAAGQHDRAPVGGDEDADVNAQEGDSGAASGAAIGGAAGLVVGVATIPVLGPFAAAAGLAVGAYTGSLSGAVQAMGDRTDKDGRSVPEVQTRPAGVRLVVRVPTAPQRTRALATFDRHHARSVEEADGTWRDGTWFDFDPVSVPHWVVPPVR